MYSKEQEHINEINALKDKVSEYERHKKMQSRRYEIISSLYDLKVDKVVSLTTKNKRLQRTVDDFQMDCAELSRCNAYYIKKIGELTTTKCELEDEIKKLNLKLIDAFLSN